jgi:dihydropyrimidine dehydrogenase (NAD+) subunit PreT
VAEVHPPHSSANARPRRESGRWFAPALIAVLAGVAILVLLGRDYYLLPLVERHGSHFHKRLRSSGPIGHLYGYIGIGLMLVNLLYLVRRRLARVKWLGAMRVWMDVHVLTGLAAGGMVLVHSALTLRTQVAIAATAALVIVIATGALGRWIYTMLPRGTDGRARSHEEVSGEVDRAFMALRDVPGGREAVEAIEAEVGAAIGPPPSGRISGPRALLATARVRARLHRVPSVARRAAAAAGAKGGDVRRVGRLARQIGLAQFRADLLNVLEAAGSSWRGLHRLLAVTMVLAASLHISIAIYLGYVL